tara:strand:- start:415 stop:963 length:549 start_codon:yes stop_codon:yes gene_type:complete
MNKKGDIWISAVLYMALGVILLAIILGTSLPVISKLKDKNSIIQTKNLMSDIDQNIRAVYTEGTGSQRPIEVEINRGKFEIDITDDTGEKMIWTIEDSRFIEVEPDGPGIKEGNILIETQNTAKEGRYIVTLTLDYSTLFDLQGDLTQIEGKQSFLIRNAGVNDDYGAGSETRPIIEVKELG